MSEAAGPEEVREDATMDIDSAPEVEGSEIVDASEASPTEPADGAPKRGRGRPPGSGKKQRVLAPDMGSSPSQIPLGPDGKPYELGDDELVLPKDPQGETKVDEMGHLQGGRDYRVRTFTIGSRGDGQRLYMLSTEPARCVGFRDSYLLFQKHRRLWKLVVTDAEKHDLIERGIIPHSYKGRAIGVVTARSIFLEFGARIVIGGRRVVDDYYEAEARAQCEQNGTEEGTLADPDAKMPPDGQPYNKNQYVAWHGASHVYHSHDLALDADLGGLESPVVGQNDAGGGTVDSGTANEPQVTPLKNETWLYDHARAASRFNHDLVIRRRNRLHKLAGNLEILADLGTPQEVRRSACEPHTGVAFMPATTQPRHARWSHAAAVNNEDTDGVVVSTVMETKGRTTGLSESSPRVRAVADKDDDLRRAVAKQVALEQFT